MGPMSILVDERRAFLLPFFFNEEKLAVTIYTKHGRNDEKRKREQRRMTARLVTFVPIGYARRGGIGSKLRLVMKEERRKWLLMWRRRYWNIMVGYYDGTGTGTAMVMVIHENEEVDTKEREVEGRKGRDLYTPMLDKSPCQEEPRGALDIIA